MPRESRRSFQPEGVVKVGVASAIQVVVTIDLAIVRVCASHVEVVDDAFCRTLTAPMGLVWWQL